MPGVVGKALYPSSPVRQFDNIYRTDCVHENTWLGEKCWILEIFESPPLFDTQMLIHKVVSLIPTLPVLGESQPGSMKQ